MYVEVPKVDRSALGAQLLKLVIVEAHDETGMYRLASQHGVLQKMVDGRQIYKPSDTQEGADAIFQAWRAGTLKKKPLRTLCNKVDMFGGQGKRKCSCTKGCKTMSCGCRSGRPSAQCNSACHCNKLGNCHNSSAHPQRWIKLAPGQKDNDASDDHASDLEDAEWTNTAIADWSKLIAGWHPSNCNEN